MYKQCQGVVILVRTTQFSVDQKYILYHEAKIKLAMYDNELQHNL